MSVVWRVYRTEEKGPPSVKVLTKSLAGLQDLANDLGKAHAALDPSFARESDVEIQRQCELFVMGLRYGSVEITVGTGAPPGELWPDRAKPFLGPKVEADLGSFIDAMEAGDEAKLEEIVPDPMRRAKAAKDLITAIPAPESGHAVSWAHGDRAPQRFRPPTQSFLTKLISVPAAALAGVVLSQSVISGTCVATLKDGRPEHVSQWLTYEVIGNEDARPYVIDKVIWGGQQYVLDHGIECTVTRDEPLTIIEYEPLRIRAFGPTREEAIRDFAEDFAFLWETYEHAPEEQLTRSAVDLKVHLMNLVREVGPVDVQEGPISPPEAT